MRYEQNIETSLLLELFSCVPLIHGIVNLHMLWPEESCEGIDHDGEGEICLLF